MGLCVFSARLDVSFSRSRWAGKEGLKTVEGERESGRRGVGEQKLRLASHRGGPRALSIL